MGGRAGLRVHTRASDGRADLHVHTRASDGRATPEEAVAAALAAGLDALGIADHDTTAGIGPAIQAARGTALEVVPGVEINTDHGELEVHVLGYFFRLGDPRLEEQLEALRRCRLARGEAMVGRLAALGLPVALDRVLALAGGGSVGRPHVAQAMVESGHVHSAGEAFDRYLARGRPAYVERARFSPSEAVDLVRAAGGIPVLAHPGSRAGALVSRLVMRGLAGLEVYHPDHPPEVVLHLLRLAAEHGLVVTGGSDAHGTAGAPGAAVGAVTVPAGAVEQLRRRAGTATRL